MAVILLMNTSISESKLLHSTMGLKPNQSLKQLQTLKEVGQYVYISWSKTFYAASYNHRKLKVQFWGHMFCQRPGVFFFFSLSRIYLILPFFFFPSLFICDLTSSFCSHFTVSLSLLVSSLCFLWSRAESSQHRLKELYQHYQLALIHLANPLLFKGSIWYTVMALYFAKLFWELSPNSWIFAGINCTTHCISQDTGACISFKELHNSSRGIMSLFHCYLFSSCLLHFLSESPIPALHLSSAFSTIWVDHFRTRFCSVVTCLVQTRPGKFVWLK